MQFNEFRKWEFFWLLVYHIFESENAYLESEMWKK